jgi:serine/threonine-protein kinase
MQVGDYQILRELGAGGMGKVFQVRNVISDRIEAMKVLLPDLAGDQGLADRFLREIKVQAALDHPNIAGLRTAMRDGNQLLMVMEFVEGRTVTDYMAQGPLPAQNAAGICMEVLSALEYAHSRGIVHRDIKPSNIMITTQGQVKLMDFGIARVMSDPSLTQTHQTTGSLYYMSPEQINGAALDGRSDLYSLAITLYEMVTGRRPFNGENTFAIMAAHMQQAPVPPVQIDTRVPAGLSDVILAGMAKDPNARFQTAGQFRAALGAVLRGPAPVAEPHPSPAEFGAPAPLPVKSSSTRMLYMLAGSLATVAVLAVLITQAPRFLKTSAQQPPPAQTSGGEVPPPAPAAQVPEPAPVTPQPQTHVPAPVVKAGAARPEMQSPAVASPAPQTAAPAAPAPVSAPPVYAPVPPAAPPQPAVDRSALDEQRKRVIQMAQRIATAKTALQSLRESMAQQGLRPRAELQGSSQRMQFEMDQAEAALSAGDVARARQHLDYAERALESLEKALNL